LVLIKPFFPFALLSGEFDSSVNESNPCSEEWKEIATENQIDILEKIKEHFKTTLESDGSVNTQTQKVAVCEEEFVNTESVFPNYITDREFVDKYEDYDWHSVAVQDQQPLSIIQLFQPIGVDYNAKRPLCMFQPRWNTRTLHESERMKDLYKVLVGEKSPTSAVDANSVVVHPFKEKIFDKKEDDKDNGLCNHITCGDYKDSKCKVKAVAAPMRTKDLRDIFKKLFDVDYEDYDELPDESVVEKFDGYFACRIFNTVVRVLSVLFDSLRSPKDWILFHTFVSKKHGAKLHAAFGMMTERHLPNVIFEAVVMFLALHECRSALVDGICRVGTWRLAYLVKDIMQNGFRVKDLQI
jgi:hypothetical protein